MRYMRDMVLFYTAYWLQELFLKCGFEWQWDMWLTVFAPPPAITISPLDRSRCQDQPHHLVKCILSYLDQRTDHRIRCLRTATIGRFGDERRRRRVDGRLPRINE